MKQQSIIYAVAGLIIGVVLTGFVMANKNTQNTSEPSQSMSHETSSSMSMEEMMADLKGKSGDEFDKAFLTAMIAHHKDALTMAKEAKEKAERDEIKNLADEIISAQTTEINQMQEWQKDWGFTQ